MSLFMRGVIATVAVSGLVLLSACGGGDDGSGKRDIEGAKDGGGQPASASPSASASASGDPGAPKLDLPEGVHVVLDGDDMTGDPEKDEILRDHADAVNAMALAYSTGKPDVPVVHTYFQDDAGKQVQSRVKEYRAEGKLGTGTYRYYDRRVTVGKEAAAVTFCESQRDAFAKMVDTGKVVHTKPSKSDFTSGKAIMEKRGGTWVVISMAGKGGDEECAR
ncbi:hypothetical protein [Streptomyces sp. AA1529]|uniref:hypothetical protein n=1 Tax=Streptomyces sp. AA1529 TaxID=1203257 RepID=UPI00037E119A|nr:hypothetical protein [Streptomyces sp. AA1529]